MGIGSLGVVRYWESFAAIIDGKPSFLFLDYRRQKGLTAIARRFVFSLMSEQIRGTDPDFHDADLKILQFTQKKGEARIVQDHTFDPDSLFTLSELNNMIDETYLIWQAVQLERRMDDRPKRAGGGLF